MLVSADKRSFHPVATDILVSLWHHRLLSTPQLHALHMPDKGMHWTQAVLGDLERNDPPLVQYVGTRTAPPTRLRFLTDAGRDAVEQGPVLVPRVDVTREAAAGPLQAHTLAVNDVGIAFALAAHARDDECGALSWRHEVAHPITAGGPNKVGTRLIADAVLRYTLYEEDGGAALLTRFVELDRATMPLEDLAGKIRMYARLHDFAPDGTEPAWRALYPQRFPQVLVVFTGKKRGALERRMHALLARIAGDHQVNAAAALNVSCVLLDDLIRMRRVGKELHYALPDDGGPFAPVFLRHSNPGAYVDWLGRE